MARLSSAERDNPAPFNFFFVRERETERNSSFTAQKSWGGEIRNSIRICPLYYKTAERTTREEMI